MPHDVDEPFAALGAGQRDELVQLAALLSADDGTDAGLLARSALVTAGRRRRAGTDLVSSARVELVRRAVGPQAEVVPGRRSDSLSASDPDGFEVLRRELARLPPRTRTALVLARWADWSEQEIAATLRCPTDDVRTEIARGAAVVRSALHPASAYRRPVETFVHLDTEREVREALDGLARSLASSGTPLPPPEALRREVARSRRRWWLGGLAACCGAALVAVVVLAGGGGGGRTPAEEAVGTTAGATAPRDVDIADLAPRGSLSRDAAFLAALTELPWTDDVTTEVPMEIPTVPGTRRVLFAGDVPGARWALLVGEPAPVEAEEPGVVVVTDELIMAWLVGPPGAAPAEMTLASYPYGLAPGSVPALFDPRTGTMVVVAAQGDTVEVSQRIDIDADGQDSRSWVPAEMDDGIGVVRLDPSDLPWSWATVFRVQRDGRQTITSSPDGILVPFEEQVFDLGIEFPRPPTPEERYAAGWAAQAVLATTGHSPRDVGMTVQALVAVPAPAAGALALVTVELPSGATVVSAQWAREAYDTHTAGADCGMEVRPAGQPPEDGVLAARCELWDPVDGRGLGTVLLVVTPPQVDRVRLYRGDSGFLAEHDVPDDGVLLVPSPEGLGEIEAVTEGGVLLGRTRPLGHWMPGD